MNAQRALPGRRNILGNERGLADGAGREARRRPEVRRVQPDEVREAGRRGVERGVGGPQPDQGLAPRLPKVKNSNIPYI